jgi:hypothetical protein
MGSVVKTIDLTLSKKQTKALKRMKSSSNIFWMSYSNS